MHLASTPLFATHTSKCHDFMYNERLQRSKNFGLIPVSSELGPGHIRNVGSDKNLKLAAENYCGFFVARRPLLG